MLPAVTGERNDVVLGEPADGHRVHLDRGEPGPLCGIQPGQYLFQPVAARELAEAAGVERIERHVQPPQPRVEQGVSVFCKKNAIGGQSDIANAGYRDEHAGELVQVLPHQRLAAGEPHLVHSQSRRDAHERGDLFKTEQFGPVEERHLFGHAVGAAEVAPVGHGDAEVVMPPAEGIHERRTRSTERGTEIRLRVARQF